MGRVITRLAGIGLGLLLLLPAAAGAQAAITGVVKDASGAVLPGVTVDAASPVLIEKVRSVVSDSTGQYRIVNLLPGTYSVTFTLPGFSTAIRDGIELTGTFVATVNGELKVGTLEETVTVSGATPVVDVQSVRVQQTVSDEVLAAIPSARTAASIQQLIPGLLAVRGDVGGASGSFGGDTGSIHGGRPADSRTYNDGLGTNHAGGATGSGNNANVAGAQEIVISTSGGLGEAETSGVSLNIIPREGGNTFKGTVFVNGANGAMQSSNYTQSLKSQGLTAPSEILKVYDINPMGGGPILKDRLWFYLTERVWGAENTIPGMFINKNAGNPNAWTYEPDLTRQAFSDTVNKTHILRLTWQATRRNKFTAYWSEQYNCESCLGGGSATQTTEATGQQEITNSRIPQATYSSPVTSRFLVEAGVGAYVARYGNGWSSGGREDGTHNPAMIRVVEQGGSIPGLAYRAPATYTRNNIATKTWRASASFVPGAHNMKVGYFGGFINPANRNFSYGEVTQYRFNNGVPNQLTMTGTYPTLQSINRNLVLTSFYAQDQWTSRRLTLQGGVRYDNTITSYPEQRVGGTRIIPVETVFPSRSTPGVHWNDITPRMGAAYDLFGNGKTAVKFNLGKYVDALQVGSSDHLNLNPIARLVLSTTRSWNDTNRNYVPDCDLANVNQNGECGDMANKKLGENAFSRTFDPAFVTGWGNRQYNWEMGLSVQQELAPRVSVTVGYFRRWFGNWYVVDDRATGLADYTPFSIIAPADPRLPGGGGQTVGTLYDLVPEKVGQIDEFATSASNFGKQSEKWHGVDVNLVARTQNGLTVQGGVSTGRRVADSCAVRAVLPELGTAPPSTSASPVPITIPNGVSPTSPYCRLVEPFLTRATGLAAYLIPKVAVQVSATWQSNPGPELAANYNVPNAVVRQTLGRDLSGGAANIRVNLVEPGTLYGDRINQLDLRIAKILTFGHTRTQIALDLYNAMNTDTPTTYNQTFVPRGQWLTPTSVLTARFAKIGVQFDF